MMATGARQRHGRGPRGTGGFPTRLLLALGVAVGLAGLVLLARGARDAAQATAWAGAYQELQPARPITLTAPPPAEVLLTLRGAVGVTNRGAQLDLGWAQLAALRQVRLVVDDPDLKRQAVYDGVLLQDVLALAEAPRTITALDCVALNDYRISIPGAILTRWPLVIAHTRDGQRLEVRSKGPLEIVFPNRAFAIDPVRYNQMWVWHLREITIR